MAQRDWFGHFWWRPEDKAKLMAMRRGYISIDLTLFGPPLTHREESGWYQLLEKK